MSKNSLYPTTPSGICVTSIIKDKIREYMMSDSPPNHAGKSSFDISASEININVTTGNSTFKNRRDSSMKDVDNVKVDQLRTSDAQDAVSTTDFGLPSSLDVSIHNACEPCPHRQDIVAASVRRIGNSLDALFRESKQATHVRAIKKTPNSESSNLQNSGTIFATAGEKIRYRKGVTLHDICEEYIQFITVNSSTGSADEDTVTTTCETDSHKRCPSSVEPELEIIPIGLPMSGDKRIAQISVITINESLTENVKKHAFSNGSCDEIDNESRKTEAKSSTANKR